MIIAVTMVRDEADIIGHTLAHMAAQVDHVIVADNRSTDRTPDILTAWAANVGHLTINTDPEIAYFQDNKMTALAHEAWQMGARWVVPFDADEAWYHLDFLRTEDADDYDIVTARPYVFVPHDADDDDEPNPIHRMLWRTPQPEPHPKVVFRAGPHARLHMGNHGVDNVGPRVLHHRLGCRHYQFRSLDQLRRKVRNGMEAYTAAGSARASSGSYWRDLWAMDAIPGRLEEWWQHYVNQHLVHDPDF